jgi:hypothetical protein
MKKFILLLIIMPIIFAATSQRLGATTIGHCYGRFYIDDDSYTSGDYYDVYIRLETSDPFASSWIHIGTYYNQGVPYTFTNVNVGDVPYPAPIPANYYRIGVLVIKNGDTGSPFYNNSYATASYIDANNTRFDADTSPIVIKI